VLTGGERRLFWVGAALEPPFMEPRRGPLCVEAWPEGLDGYGGGCPPGSPSLGQSSVLMPSLCDAHIHLPDAAVADTGEDLGLHELVAQPSGLKYRLLARTPPALAEAAAGELLQALMREGVVAAAAYAEPGFWRATLRAALAAGFPVLRVLAQPREKRLPSVLEALVDGFWVGLDTPLDMEPWELRLAAEEARRRGAQVHAHVAEDPALAATGDLWAALDAGIDVLVHVTHLGPGEVLEAARAGVGIVLCPLANLYFTAAAPPPETLLALYDEQAAAGLGSDNAAWPPQGLGAVLASAYGLYRARLGPGHRSALARALLYAATTGCGRIVGARLGWQVRRVPLLGYSSDPAVAVVKRLALSPPPIVVEPARPLGPASPRL
jgi:cytosine/adenosine deaminase-related metal-dependent hydrolase